MAARYWRVNALGTDVPGTLEISEIQLHSTAGRADAAVTLTCTRAPDTGSLASVQDGSAAASCTWSHADAPGFAFNWDFGSAVDIAGVRFGSGASSAGFPRRFSLEYFDGAQWQLQLRTGDIVFPGVNALIPFDPTANPMYTLQAQTVAVIDAGVPVVAGQVLPQLTLRIIQADNYTWRTGDNYRATFGVIEGTVAEDGTPDTPVHRRVRIYRERDGLFLAETWSDAITGAYSFRDLDLQFTYTVLAYDYEHNFRAVVADNIVPVTA